MIPVYITSIYRTFLSLKTHISCHIILYRHNIIFYWRHGPADTRHNNDVFMTRCRFGVIMALSWLHMPGVLDKISQQKPRWESVGMRRNFDPHFLHLNAFRRYFCHPNLTKVNHFIQILLVPFRTSSGAPLLLILYLPGDCKHAKLLPSRSVYTWFTLKNMGNIHFSEEHLIQ